jgi:hypothetical protein
MMQLLESREAKGHGRQSVGIELPLGGGDGHVTKHVGAELDDTAAPQRGDVGEPHEREGAPAERVARIGNGYRLLRRKRRAERGSTVVVLSRTHRCR